MHFLCEKCDLCVERCVVESWLVSMLFSYLPFYLSLYNLLFAAVFSVFTLFYPYFLSAFIIFYIVVFFNKKNLSVAMLFFAHFIEKKKFAYIAGCRNLNNNILVFSLFDNANDRRSKI